MNVEDEQCGSWWNLILEVLILRHKLDTAEERQQTSETNYLKCVSAIPAMPAILNCVHVPSEVFVILYEVILSVQFV